MKKNDPDSLAQFPRNRQRICFSLGRFSFQSPVFALLLFLTLPFAHLGAAQLQQARVSQVIKDVKLLPGQTAPRPAHISDEVRNGTAVRTGLESRAELTFIDQTLARLGANTIFGFDQGTRKLELGGGAMLLRVPKNAGGAQINTAAITAAITGTTVMLEFHPNAYVKFIVLEGTGRIFRNDRVGESVLVHAGQMLIANPKGKGLPEPVDVDLSRLMKTSLLINGFAPLPSGDLIARVISAQSTQKNDGGLIETNLVIFGGGTAVSLTEATAAVDQRAAVLQTTARPSTPTPPPTPAPVATYNSGAGNWSDPNRWTPAIVPNNGNQGATYDARFSSGALTQDFVNGVTINQLFMSGGTLILANPLTLEVGLQFSGGAITLGTLNVAGNSTQSAQMTVNGTTINNSGTYDITLTNGDAFSGGSSTFNNSGTLTANSLDGPISFNIQLNNTGTVSAESGTLSLVGGGTNSGTLSAAAGTLLQIASNFSLTDGTHFSGEGLIQFSDGTSTNLSGTITNTGNVLIDSSGSFTDFVLNGDVTLTGGGMITLTNADRILGSGVLTNVDNTIAGETSTGGSLGANAIGIINQANGLIDADVSGLILDVDPDSGNGLINNGTLKASGGGILQLNGNGGGTFTNNNLIEALDGSQVQLINGATVIGGTLLTAGSGTIHNVNTATLNTLTLTGAFTANDNTTTTLVGTITNMGAISLNSAGNLTDLVLSGDVTMAGGGTINLTAADRILGSGILTNVNNLIEGDTNTSGGSLGANAIGLVNQTAGVINANNSGLVLNVDPNSANGLINQGLMEASNGGILLLTGNGGGGFTNTGGTITAQTGSVVQFTNGASVTGGTLNAIGTGVLQNLDAVTLNSLTLTGSFVANNNSTTTLNGAIANTGSISLNSTGNFTDLSLGSNVTLTGGGVINLVNADRILGSGILTNFNNTIEGETHSGSLGNNGIGIVNQAGGLINANVSGLTLNVDPDSTDGLVNQGTMEASNGGILLLNGNGGGSFTNSGTIVASGGTLQFSGTVTSSGTVDVGSDSLSVTGSYTQSAGTFRLAGGTVTSSSALNFMGGLIDARGTMTAGLTNSANLQPALGGSGLAVTGAVSLLSASQLTFQLGGLTQGSEYGFLNVNGTVALGGQLVLSFVNGFQNSVNGSDTFTVLSSSFNFSGMFSNVASGTRLETSDGFGSFLVTYSGNNVVLSNFLPAGSVIEAIWTGSSGNWSNGTNWSTNPNFPNNGQPGSNDLYNATLNNGGTITLNLPITIQKFTLSSGTVTGTNPLTANQLFTWGGGSLAGGLTLNANGGILLGSSTVSLNGSTLNNASGQSTTLSGGAQVAFLNGAIWNNNGTFLAQNDNSLFNNGGGGVFNNIGTFTRNTGTNTFTIGSGVVFNNTGTVNVNSGTLQLSGGDNGATTGDFNIAAGATLLLNSNFTFGATSDLTGAGVINFNGASQQLNGTYTLSDLNLNGSTLTSNIALNVARFNFLSGTFSSAQSLNLSGLFTWNSGTLNGSGAANANGGILLNSGTVSLNGKTLNNASGQSTTLSGGAQVAFLNGAIWNNNGTFLAQNDNSLFNNGGGGLFNNIGTFTRNTGTNTFTIGSGVVFNNSGTVNAQTGTLAFNGGYTQTAGTLNLAGGNVQSNTALDIEGGLLTGIGTITAAITNNALLRPGLGVGGLAVTGNVSLLSASNLSFQLGGLTQGSEYGFLNVNGTVALGGQLVLSFVNGFQNSITGSDTFTVLSSSFNFSGMFSNVASGTRLDTSDGFGSFLVTYSGNNLILSDFMPFGMSITSTWEGGTGNWSDPLGWNPNIVPNNGNNGSTFNVVFGNGSLTQDIAPGVTIQQLQMTGGTLILSNPLTLNVGLQFSGGAITSGPLNIAGLSSQSALMTVSNTTLNNSGSYDLVLNGNAFSGGGSVFNNSGTLTAHATDGAVTFNIPLSNTGNVSAEVGAFVLTGGGSNSGTLAAASGAVLEFASNFTLTDGTQFSGDGVIQFDNNTTTTLSGTITNNTNVLLNSTGNFTDFVLNGDVTFSGTGVLTLQNADRIRGSGTFINAGGTIEGSTNTSGSFGNNEIGIVNQSGGVIDANVPGLFLNVDPNSGLGLTNTGIMQASNGGLLLLNGNGGGGVNNAGGTITALDGSQVQLSNGIVITGGTFTTAGTGTINNLNTVTLISLTNAGSFVSNNNTATTLVGTMTNTGTILLNSAANFTDLVLSGDVTLTGGGTISLTNFGRILGSGILTNVDNLIEGNANSGGSLGANAIGLINQAAGVINANNSGLVLNVDPDSNDGLVNRGLMEASNGGILLLTGNGGGTFTNTGGTITATNGSEVQLTNSASITGGMLSASGSGVIRNLDSASLNSLTIADIFIGNNNSTTTISGTITSTATISLNSTVNFTDLVLSGDVTLAGGGTISLTNFARIRGGGVLTNVDNLIEGNANAGGSLGANAIGLINQVAGVINANNSGLILNVDPDSNDGLVNQGLMEASNGGILLLTGNGGGGFTNTGATITAMDGSEVQLTNSASITGGTLTTSGSGVIRNLDNATLTSLTIAGTFIANNNTTTTLAGTIIDTGSILLNSTVNLTNLVINSEVTLTGGSTLELVNAARVLGGGTLFIGGSDGEAFTVEGNTNTSGGSLGANELAIVNQTGGLIDANTVDGNNNGLVLVVDPRSGDGLTNLGVMRASNGGILLLTGNGGGDFNNAGGLIEALDGSQVQLASSATINNGILMSLGTGFVVNLGTATLNTLTLSGTFIANNNTTTTLVGTITNTGTISPLSTGNLTDLSLSGDVTLMGGGTINLTNADRILGSGILTNVNNLIQGDTNTSGGSLGANAIGLINQAAGVINANNSGLILNIDPDAADGLVNHGLIEASNGGILLLTGNGGGGFTNTGATITALNGSILQLINGASISGGVLSSVGTGMIVNLGSATLSSLTLAGNFTGANNSTTTLTGTITNTGTISPLSTGNLTDLTLSGNVTLTGGGTVNLVNADRILGSGILTNVNNLIEGDTNTSGGSLGANAIGLVNQTAGVINANNSGLVLNVDPNSANGLINQGLMEASNGGILLLTGNGGGGFTNTGGTITAQTGSVVQFTNGASVTGGTLNAIGTGVLQNLDAVTLNSLTLTGSFVANNNSTTTLNGAIANTGSISLNSTGNFTDLSLGSNVTLTGGGVINLVNADRILGSGILTNFNNTIEGETHSGSLGNNGIGIVNQAGGLINANVSGLTLNVDPDSTDGLVNQGTMEASNGGILLLNGNGGGSFTNSGTIVASGGTLQFSGTVTSSGTVDVGSDSLSVTGSYTQSAGTFRLAGGTVTSSSALNFMGGLIDARGTMTAGLTNSANLQPALGGSGLAVTGAVSLLSASQLTFQLGGLTQGSEYGFLNVNGTVALGGQLVLSFVNGFQNSVNGSDTFTVLSSSFNFSGMFSNVASGTRLETSDGFGSFLVTYSGNNVVLSNFLPAGSVIEAIWTGSSGNWSNGTNWSTNPNFPNNGQPGSNDLYNATLNNGGTITLNLPITIQKFTLSSGTVTGTNPLTMNDLFTWSGGTMSGSGVTNANGGILMNGSYIYLDQRTLNNATGQTATFNTNGYYLYLSNGATFNNNGTFLAQNDYGYIYDNGVGANTFNNTGTFTRNTGSNDFSIYTLFNNTGTVNVQSGILTLAGGDGGSTTGDFNISSGATLQFSSDFNLAASANISGAGTAEFSAGTVNIAGTYNVTGASTFDGATVNFNSPIASTGPLSISGGSVFFNSNNITVPTLTLTGGTLGGTIAQVTSSGLLTWSGGTMSGTGVTNANGGILMNGSYIYLDQRTLNNAAGQTATFNTNGYYLYLSNGATFNNNGTFLAQNDYGYIYDNGVGANTFNNTGTFTRNTGSNDFSIYTLFNNTGTVNVQSGILTLAGGDGGSTTGDFNISSGATLQFMSDFNLAASANIGGAGLAEFNGGTVNILNSTVANVLIDGGTANFNANTSAASLTLSYGTLGGTGNFASTGLLTWSGGTMSGSGVTNANGGILMNGSYIYLDQRTLNNATGQTATFNTNGYYLYLSNGATFNNNGTFLAQNDYGYIYDNGVGANTFNNTGTFTRNTGSNDFSIYTLFNNTGTVNVQSGILTLAGGDGGSTTGDFNISSGATLQFSSDFNLAASANISGAGTAEFSAGTVNIAGTYNVTGASTFDGATVNFNSPIASTGPLSISGGSVFFNSNNITVPTLTLTGGTLGGTIAQVTSSGLLTWSGGTMSGSGVTNANGGILMNGSYIYLDQRTLNNAAGQTATFNTNGYYLYLSNGATFNNNGTFLAQNDYGYIYDNGVGANTFNNTGTFTRNTGSNDFSIYTLFNNTGTVNVQSGILTLAGGDGGSTTGDFNISSGATLQFSSDFNLAASANIGGAGLAEFNGGTVNILNSTVANVLIDGGTANFNANTSAASLTLSNGTLGGTGNFASTGLLTWNGGTMSGSGVTNANGGILMNGSYIYLDQRTLNNATGQTATFNTNGYYLYLSNGATFNNNGTFLAQNDYGYIYDNGVGANTFNNAGTFTRNTGSNDFSIYTLFNNTGTVNVQSGILTLAGGDGGSTTGDFNISSGATLQFSSDFNLAASANIGGAGTAEFSAGTVNILSSSVSNLLIDGGTANFNAATTAASLALTSGTLGGTGTFTSTGLFTWNYGTLTGTGVLNANGGILMGNNYYLYLDQRTLNNATGQTATFNGAYGLYLSNGALFNNNGTFLAQSDYGYLADNGGGGTFNNTGTFTRNTGTSVFAIGSGIAFNNSGTVNVQTGTLEFDGGYTQTAGTLNLAGGNVQSSTALDIEGGLLTGVGNITAAITNNALIRPGLGVGGLAVTGNASLLSASNLSFQLGGLTQGTQYGFFNVNGTVDLGGQLLLSFVNNFQNLVTGSDTFTVVSAASNFTGAFSNVASGTRLLTSDGFGTFVVTYTGSNVVLSNFIAGGLAPLSFAGANSSTGNGGNGGTLSLTMPAITFGLGSGEIPGAYFSGGNAPDGSAFLGGDGGTLAITANTGDIVVGADIEASTGSSGADVPAGKGGSVTLTANTGTVTVNNRIQVSHNTVKRRSASGGTIALKSGRTSGVAINVSNTGQLLSLLDAAAPGPGGKIIIQATAPTGNSQVNVSGTLQADRGTVDIRHSGASGQINLTNANIHADAIKAAALGSNGVLQVGGGSLSADTTLQLYATSGNGQVVFVGNVSLNGNSTKSIAGNSVTIRNGVLVNVAGPKASVYVNSTGSIPNANYSGFGGNGHTSGTFGGSGANPPQPLSNAPPLGLPPGG